MIRKDFTVDEYQIYQAKVLGADAVLLICTLLDTETIRDYIGICDKLGMSALVETHDAQEMQSAVQAGAHRGQQPKSQGLYSRPRKRGKAAERHAERHGFCGGERRFLAGGRCGAAQNGRGRDSRW